MTETNSKELKEKQQLYANRYEITGEIGRGASSIVYSARDCLLDREIALKVLNLENLEPSEKVKSIARFRKEAQICSKLSHPNIVKVLSFGQEDEDRVFLGMELIKGKTLQEILEKEKNLNASSFMELFLPVMDALEYAHSMRLIHRDIKPSNIILSEDEAKNCTVKLLDFGIAQTEDSSPNQAMTSTLALVGTALYMSPEQCSGKPCDARSDVYSLACVMYQSIAGKPPFTANTSAQTMYAQINESAPTLTDISSTLEIPRSLAAAIMKALAKDPARRPSSMRDFKKEITDASSSERYLKKKANKTQLALGGVAIIAAVSAVAIFARMQEQDKLSRANTSTSKEPLQTKQGKSAALPSAEFFLCRTLINQGKYEEANFRLSKLLSRVKGSQDSSIVAATYATLAESYILTKRYEEAERVSREALTQFKLGESSLSSLPMDELAKSLLLQKRVDEAEALYKDAISSMEKQYINKGLTDTDKALSYSGACYGYATLLEKENKPAEALEQLSKASKGYSSYPSGKTSQGAVLTAITFHDIAKRLGKNDLAERVLNEKFATLLKDSEEKDKTFPGADADMARYLARLGRFRESTKMWKHLFSQLSSIGIDLEADEERKWRAEYELAKAKLNSENSK